MNPLPSPTIQVPQSITPQTSPISNSHTNSTPNHILSSSSSTNTLQPRLTSRPPLTVKYVLPLNALDYLVLVLPPNPLCSIPTITHSHSLPMLTLIIMPILMLLPAASFPVLRSLRTRPLEPT